MLETQRMAIIEWIGSQIIQVKNLNTNYKRIMMMMMMLTDKHCSWAVHSESGARRYLNLEKMPGAFSSMLASRVKASHICTTALQSNNNTPNSNNGFKIQRINTMRAIISSIIMHKKQKQKKTNIQIKMHILSIPSSSNSWEANGDSQTKPKNSGKNYCRLSCK